MPQAYFRGRRPQLFLGSAVAALAAAASVPALATSPGVSARGARVVASDQSQIGNAITATASNPVIMTTAVPTDARIDVSSNTVAATARGNQAANSQSPDALDLTSAEDGTWLSTGSFAVDATAPAVIANLQRTQAAPVTAKVIGSRIAAENGQVVDSAVTVADNRQEAVALANDAANALSLTRIDGGSGAGIASRQSVGTGSPVLSRMSGKVEVIAQGAVDSALRLDGNLQRSMAYGNAAANALAANAVTLATPTSWGFASIVSGYGSPEVSAAYSLLSDQSTQSRVKASTDGGYRLLVRQLATGSEMSADANAIIAAGYGNQSANAATLDGVDIGAEYGFGAIANVTNVQRAKAAVSAETSGATKVWLANDSVEARVAADRNAIQAVATANLASGNQLEVHATSIGNGNNGWGGGGEGPGGVIGTAGLGHGNALTVTAPLSVQNAQTFRAPVSAVVQDSMTRITDWGAFVNSSGWVSGNSVKAAATGNSGTSGLTLDAVSLATAADLNSGQFGDGDVLVKIGSRSDRTGASIAGLSDVVGSSLSVADNTVQGLATANIAANAMKVAATQLTNGSGHDDATAGPDGSSVAAAADYALANHQLLGSDRTIAVTSDVAGRFAATGGDVVQSSLSVAGNSQSSAARGNVASNLLELTATNLGGDGERAPGTALSSFQAADAHVSATSDLVLDLTGTAVKSRLTLDGNSNTAFAQINGADNTSVIEAVHIREMSGDNAAAEVWTGEPGSVAGDHVLANNQTAAGSAVAKAVTKSVTPGYGGTLFESAWVATGNTTTAQGAANQASNSLAVTSAADRDAGAGLLNAQASDANVLAAATSDIEHSAHSLPGSQVTIDGNGTAALARGNTADNRLTLTGGSGSSLPTEATAVLGSFSRPSGSAMVLNAQTNTGAVTARAENVIYRTALNGGAYESGIALNGNSASAGASGNSASNSLALASLDRLPTASLANVQVNSGPVSAQVIGATFRLITGGLTSNNLAVTGNIVSASATGNVATNAITSAR